MAIVKANGEFEADLRPALAWLKSHATKANLDGMSRYAIPSAHALGVAMRDIKALGKEIGRNHALALALWETGLYEARMLASFVGDPEKLTSAQMDAWRKEFDNWAICDAMAFNLFDRSPHAWAKVKQWSRGRGEFEKRAGFALLWSLTVHDKKSGDEPFVEGLALIEREAGDDRTYVKKAVNMALRATGKRNAKLRAAAIEVARRLAGSESKSAKWVGSDALRELAGRSR
jgi:3-methyladenine DNA glycosylase AlkD